VAEVLGNEAGVAALLAEPGRRGVAQRVRGDVLLDPSALRRATDDVGEDCLLQASAGKSAEDGIHRLGLAGVPQLPQLAGQARRYWLAPRFAALPATDEERALSPIELHVAPLERAELGAAQPGRDEGEQREPVALGEAGQVPLGPAGGAE
jgi:hypothetical protein